MKKIKEDFLLQVISENRSTFGDDLSEAFELNSGFGIADIVFYSLDKTIISKRVRGNLTPIKSFDLIRILIKLNQIKSKKISLTLIQNSLPSNKNSKQQILTYLIENGFLVPNPKRKSQFLKGEKYKVGLKKIIAIEAKVSNWKRGLYQAYRYREYANKSYLALHSNYIHRALKNAGEFRRFNIGLIEVSNKSISILIEPKGEQIKQNIYSALVFEELLNLNKNFFPNP